MKATCFLASVGILALAGAIGYMIGTVIPQDKLVPKGRWVTQ